MTDRFSVDDGAIGEVARAFDDEADRLSSVLARFELAAYSVHDAFGPWVSHEMLQEYLGADSASTHRR